MAAVAKLDYLHAKQQVPVVPTEEVKVQRRTLETLNFRWINLCKKNPTHHGTDHSKRIWEGVRGQ